MKAYFLHWDEELINPNRIWLPRLAQYDASYLAFLLQFYSLFFDEIYVPANFMTDNNEILKILHALDIENPNSAICSTAHPLKIIWDTVRFPSEGFAFKELLWTSHKKKSDVSYRNPHHIEEAMELCDLILSNKVVPLAVEPKYEREDSVKYLKKNVFNENQNKSEEVQDRGKELLQCLKDIERLGSDIPGYGRNIYYKIFGLSRPDPIPSHLALAKRFRSVTEKLTTDEKIAFIRSVDYVSNILKAVVTKKAMGSPEEEEWAILIPNELLRFVRYPSQDQAVGDANCVVKASELATRVLDVRSVQGMKPKELDELHTSDEYMKFKDALTVVLAFKPEEDLPDKLVAKLQGTFDRYTKKICWVLCPEHVAADFALRIALKVCRAPGFIYGFAGWVLGEAPGAFVLQGAQLVAKSIAAEMIEDKWFGRDLWHPQTWASTTDERVRLVSS